MTLPSNVRINLGAPFPAVVTGVPPFSIAKASGNWRLGLSLAGLAVQQPPTSNYATDYILVWDSVSGIFFRMPLAQFAGGAAAQRSVTAGPVSVLTTDQILNLNLAASLTITLPLATSRNGVPLVFKDIGLQANTNPITIAATAPDTIDGNPSVIISGSGQRLILTPANDGVNTGWSI